MFYQYLVENPFIILVIFAALCLAATICCAFICMIKSPFICPICGKYINEDDYVYHLRKEHSDDC